MWFKKRFFLAFLFNFSHIHFYVFKLTVEMLEIDIREEIIVCDYLPNMGKFRNLSVALMGRKFGVELWSSRTIFQH